MHRIKHLKTILTLFLALALIATPALAAGQGQGLSKSADSDKDSHTPPGQSEHSMIKYTEKTADGETLKVQIHNQTNAGNGQSQQVKVKYFEKTADNGTVKVQIQEKNRTQDLIQNQTNATNGQPGQVKVKYSEKTASGETVKVQIHTRQGAHNATSLRIMVKEKERVLNASGYNSQNTVHLAVHTFIAAGNLTGNAGPQMIQIAERFNSSANITAQAEERIEARNTFSRFLFGGDSDAAGDIQRQVIENQVRIQEMNQLMQDCECDPEVQAILMEQMQHMEQEQTRLQILAEQEQSDRGLLGGLLG